MIDSACKKSVSLRMSGGKASGFSLVELLVTAMVLIIAMAIVVPLLGSSTYSVSRAGARRMASDLQYAQDQAIVTQKDVTVHFDVNSESYWLSNESGVLIHPITNSDYKITFSGIKELSYLDIVSTSGGASVTFDTGGVPDIGQSITLRAGDSRFFVNVSAVTGTVSVAAQ